MIHPFKYLYGPIYSWRLGRSLGIDPLSYAHKICNMNCVYCQLGATGHLNCTRQEYVPTTAIIEEISRLPLQFVDYLTFSGRGEPTLAKNIGEMISRIKNIRHERVAVITNSSLLYDSQVQQDLMHADFVLAKLDAADDLTFKALNRGELDYEKVLNGIFEFRAKYKGKFALQVMLIDDNLDSIVQLGSIARNLRPDEVQLNTAVRPCGVMPIAPIEMEWAKKFFGEVPVVTVWDIPPKEYTPFDEEATVKRHGNYFKTRYGF